MCASIITRYCYSPIYCFLGLSTLWCKAKNAGVSACSECDLGTYSTSSGWKIVWKFQTWVAVSNRLALAITMFLTLYWIKELVNLVVCVGCRLHILHFLRFWILFQWRFVPLMLGPVSFRFMQWWLPYRTIWDLDLFWFPIFNSEFCSWSSQIPFDFQGCRFVFCAL